MPKNILLVGDSYLAKISSLLQDRLGFYVIHRDFGEEVPAIPQPDIVIFEAGALPPRWLNDMRQKSPSLLLLGLVGFFDYSQEEALLAAGADDMLIKPFTVARLQSTLSRLIKIRALEREVSQLRVKLQTAEASR